MYTMNMLLVIHQALSFIVTLQMTTGSNLIPGLRERSEPVRKDLQTSSHRCFVLSHGQGKSLHRSASSKARSPLSQLSKEEFFCPNLLDQVIDMLEGLSDIDEG